MRKLLLGLIGLLFAVPAVADLDPCRNLFDYNARTDGVFLNSDGTLSSQSGDAVSDFIPVEPNTTYYLSATGSRRGKFFDSNKQPIDPSSFDFTTANAPTSFTTGSTTRYVRFGMSGTTYDRTQIQLELGSTATPYTPYNASCHSSRCHAYTSATGTVTQNGTPTPDNPIEPVFYQQGNMILRKVGDIADSYDATTGKITRRVGEYIVKGTEAWSNYTVGTRRYWFDITTKEPTASSTSVLCNKYHVVSHNGDSSDNWILNSNSSQSIIMKDSRYETLEDWKAYLADQYAAGTPVIIYYPLKEAKYTTEYVGTEWCEGIKIATTAYNSARFSPVVTELNDTIATIRDVVTNTINQTKAIADLQATKQTRPNETCPAGKKCLLVEDDAGQPHWYEIIESASRLPDGYTELQYIESTGTQYIDTGIKPNGNYTVIVKGKYNNLGTGASKIYGSRTDAGSKEFIFTASSGAGSRFNIGYGTHIINSAGISSDTDVHIFKLSKGVGYVDNTVVKEFAQENFEGDYSLYLFGANYGGTVNGLSDTRIYYEEIDNANGVLIQNLIPARRNSDSVLGMYDTVSGQFFTNAGSGTFVAGPEVQ